MHHVAARRCSTFPSWSRHDDDDDLMKGAEPDLKLALMAGAVEGSGWRAQAARAARARDAPILRLRDPRIRTASGLGLILYLHQVMDM